MVLFILSLSPCLKPVYFLLSGTIGGGLLHFDLVGRLEALLKLALQDGFGAGIPGCVLLILCILNYVAMLYILYV